MVGAFIVISSVLVALEIMFWVPPMSRTWHEVKSRVYRGRGLARLLPPEYLVRLAALFIILHVLGIGGKVLTPGLILGDARAAGVSLALGAALGCAAMMLVLGVRIPWAGVVSAIRRRPGHHLYGLVWVAGVEEFIFRGLLIILMRPVLGMGSVFLSAAVMMVWHIPVWCTYAREPARYGLDGGVSPARVVSGLVGSAGLFSIVLGAVAYGTESIAGPILAHFASNFAHDVAREREMPDAGVCPEGS